MSAIKTLGPVDERSLKQLERCMDAGDAEFGITVLHEDDYFQNRQVVSLGDTRHLFP